MWAVQALDGRDIECMSTVVIALDTLETFETRLTLTQLLNELEFRGYVTEYSMKFYFEKCTSASCSETLPL